MLSSLAALVVSLNACNNKAVDPSTVGAFARTAGVVSTSLAGLHNLTTVAVSSLPATITSYISTNYAGATIDKAVQEKTSSDYIVAITTIAKKG